MPININIDKDKRRVHATLIGEVSFDEMVEAIYSAVDDPLFTPGINILSDHTKLERPIKTNQAQALATHIDKLNKHFANSKWAVVTNKQASYGMMRMLSVFLKKVPMTLEVFYSYGEADTWISQESKEN